MSAVLNAVKSLYVDKIEPNERLVMRRLQELTGNTWTPEQVLQVASNSDHICQKNIENDGYRCCLYLKGERRDFVDQRSPRDNYSSSVWAKFHKVIDSIAEPDRSQGFARSEYECAVLIWNSIKGSIQELQEYCLGHVYHMVHLALNNRKMLMYKPKGWIIPYRVRAHRVKQEGVQQCTRRCVTWKDFPFYLEDFLKDQSSPILLSDLKFRFQRRFGTQINEADLGHMNLSSLTRDDRLSFVANLENKGTQFKIVGVPRPANRQFIHTYSIDLSEPEEKTELHRSQSATI